MGGASFSLPRSGNVGAVVVAPKNGEPLEEPYKFF